MSEELELRVAWEQHLGRSPAALGWFERVLALHRAAGRHYHGVRHIVWVIRRVNELSPQVDVPLDLPPIVAAAFFHDAIYDPTASDNERRSADLATRSLADIGWAPDRCAQVADLIMATATHDPDISDLATAVVIAADLSVLAADPAGYSEYSGNVRKEYGHVSDTDWVTGRSQVVRMFLAREHVFPAVLRLVDWERQARANLTAELAMLSRGGSHDDEAAHEP